MCDASEQGRVTQSPRVFLLPEFPSCWNLKDLQVPPAQGKVSPGKNHPGTFWTCTGSPKPPPVADPCLELRLCPELSLVKHGIRLCVCVCVCENRSELLLHPDLPKFLLSTLHKQHQAGPSNAHPLLSSAAEIPGHHKAPVYPWNVPLKALSCLPELPRPPPALGLTSSAYFLQSAASFSSDVLRVFRVCISKVISLPGMRINK